MAPLEATEQLAAGENGHLTQAAAENGQDVRQLVCLTNFSPRLAQSDHFPPGASGRIRDFGRGVRYEHLTQKENQEKLRHPAVIGQFGIGLKDALAVCDRRGVQVVIRSRLVPSPHLR